MADAASMRDFVIYPPGKLNSDEITKGLFVSFQNNL